MSRGSVLPDTLVAAFVAALLLQGTLAAARLQAAGELAQEAASTAAAWAARHGDAAGAAALARALAPEADAVEVRRTPAGLAVTVRQRVPLAGPRGQVAPLVTGRAEVALSPYRSNRE